VLRRRENVTDLWEDLTWRGLVALSTDEDALRAAFADGPVTFYVGFDPTAQSLHHGHLVQLLTARRLQQAGHRPLALVGGSTGLIGDPNPDRERTLNDPSVVAGWVERITSQVEPFFSFEGSTAARVVNNLDWTAPLSAIEFLRDIGQHFRVNKMLAKEAVAARLDSDIGIGYSEFSYQILQALDFLELHRRYGCTLQTGGSDQWGNLTAGVDLIRRVEGTAVHAMATPLLSKADGTKYGKTAGGAVWLDPELLSPYGFYQFWLNLDDADVPSHLRIMSFRDRADIEELEKSTADRPAARAAQRALAEELTSVVHGEDETQKVVAASRALFGRGSLNELDEVTLAAALKETAAATINSGAELPSYVDLFAASGVVESKSAARRAIAEGGAYVNNERLEPSIDADAGPSAADLLHGRWLVLRRGKRTVGGVEIAS
jgi:tyrosyl-tRNA synthetase